MKTFFKRFGLLLLIIILIAAGIIGYFYTQAQPYITETNTDTDIAITRSIKASLRNKINQTANASVAQILQTSYNTLHIYNNKKIQNSPKTMREQSIQHTASIMDIGIQLPSILAVDIQIDTTQEDMIVFSYQEQFLGSITVYDTQEREMQEKEGLLNQEKIAEQSGYILAYAQTLDNPFDGIQLEAFGEIAQAFSQAISTVQILHITQIETVFAYITQVDTGAMTITVDPITILTGDLAAQALAEREPEVCASILSGTDQTVCFPPNNIYIINEEQDDTQTITLIASEGLQTNIHIVDRGNVAAPKKIDIQTFITDTPLYQDKVFAIQFITEGALDITEYFIPETP